MSAADALPFQFLELFSQIVFHHLLEIKIDCVGKGNTFGKIFAEKYYYTTCASKLCGNICCYNSFSLVL